MGLARKMASICMLCLLASGGAFAQPADAMPDEMALDGPVAGADPEDGFRDLTGYPFPAVSTTLRSMQLVSYAMVLRDYCADASVTDTFLRERLAWFSERTGRNESCRTLLNY